jgi:site-specific recombinase XerD
MRGDDGARVRGHRSEPSPRAAHGRTIDDVRKLVRRAGRKAGIRRDGIHILRHSFCSHLAMRGATAKAIQELAGHKDLTTTLRYMHLSPSHLEQAIRLLDHDSRGDILETGESEKLNS